MSIKCGLCNTQTKPREKVTRIVVETEEVIYPFRKNANTFMKSEKIGDKFLPGKEEKSDDPGGRGFQIVREVLACKDCTLIESLHPV